MSPLQKAFLVATFLMALFGTGYSIKKCYGTTVEPFKAKNAKTRNCTGSEDVCVRAEYYVNVIPGVTGFPALYNMTTTTPPPDVTLAIRGKTYIHRYCASSTNMVEKISADLQDIKAHTAGIDPKLRSVSTCIKDLCNGAKETERSWSLLALAVAAVCVQAMR